MTQKATTIRAAGSIDQNATIALWDAAGLTRPWNDARADFDLALKTETSTILLAEQAGTICGSVMVGFDGHRGWVYYLATAPDQRGQGIGRLMMLAAEDWLKALGSPKIQLMVRGDNHAARGFYSAIGYELQDVVTIGKRL
ncbi:MAG: GNAT family acetyltransferase [Novosphingobium sp.]|uniref:GNAT family acetyltransferase n=1 Tax=Novosphingobium sp. TaxID=1874826 RepID=UPI003B9A9067